MKKSSIYYVVSVVVAVFVASSLSLISFAAGPAAGSPGALDHKRPDVSRQKLPKGASESWWATVRKQIREDEYRIRWSDHTSIKGRNGAWQAYNPAQGFKSSFIESGVIIAPTQKPSQKKQASWVWGLSLQSWGRFGAGNKVRSVIPTVSKNRVDYSRHDIQEWYVNTENGLEQGFVLPAPPAGSGVRVEESVEKEHHYVFIDLALAGTLHPKFAEDGQAVDFFDNGNVSVLHYGSLKVNDATGQQLNASMEGYAERGGGIRIVIDDSNAVYPITVDPLTTTPTWTATGENSGDKFGFSVATAGDVNGDGYSDVIVGAYSFNSKTGKAYIYLGGPSGLSASSSWTATGEGTNNYFGYSVATAGDVNGDGYSDVIVGAYGYSSYTGKAYLYLGGPSGLSAASSWDAVGEVSDDYFGCSVATAGDVNGDGYSDVIVGAYRYSGYTGKAYLYTGGPSGLSTASSWDAVGETADNYFGISVSTAGDVNGDGYSDVIVGAYGYSSGTGKAYLYTGGPSGLSATSSWTAMGEGTNNWFGCSVAAAGDVNGDGYSDVIVGAVGYNSSKGKAYLYTGGPTGLSMTSSWTATGEYSPNSFGWSVATAGDVDGDGYSDVIVGAYGYSINTGKAYLYTGGPSGLSAASSWETAGEGIGTTYNYFGCSVATAGDVNGDGYSDVIVGAYGCSSLKGKAYLYTGGPSGLSTTDSWTAAGEGTDNYYGYSVATAGDINGDGYSDVIVGAYGYSSNKGKAYLYTGGPPGLSTASPWTATGENSGDHFGISVSTAGDVNGDGYSDVIVGATGFNSNTGKAYLYLGGPSGLSASSSWTATGEGTNNFFGFSVSTAGDVNGDGYSDVIVGAYGYSSYTGKAYLYLGGPSGLSAASSWDAVGGAASEHFGRSVATAGDVNGDGYSDVIVGAYNYSGGGTSRGRAYLYLGSASSLSSTATWTVTGDEDGAWYGWSVSTAGDVNGDGYSDIVVGASHHNGGGTSRGEAYLYLGSAFGPATSTSWTGIGNEDIALFGYSVATAGDVNGDGYSDIVIGAVNHSGGGTARGEAYLYLGSASGLVLAPEWTGDGIIDDAAYGISVASAGDVNGDGYSDVIIGAYYTSSPGWHYGNAYLYSGNGGAGVPLLPRQLRADLSAPISPLGLAYEEECRIGMRLRSPFGRTLVKLEWQVVPLRSTFNPFYTPVQNCGIWWNTGLYGIGQTTRIDLTSPDAWGPWIWRVRTRYATASTPFQSHGPWVTLSANAPLETDLRTTTAEPPAPCNSPDEPCWLYQVDKIGTDYTLNWQDPNQSDQRTGWNIRRSNDPAVPKADWPFVGTNVVDMDAGTVNYQWTDISGDDPNPSSVWYYEVTACNDNCPAEGPF